jgi:uncharacterized integral membrane protein (TIGR00697 family)
MKRQIVTSIAATMIVVANIVASKLAFVSLPIIGEASFSVGVFPIAVAFLCTDVISEKWGYDAAKGAVKSIVITLALAWGIIQLSIILPHGGGVDPSIFESVLGPSTSVIFASIATVAISQVIDITIFEKIKQETDGQRKWIRNIGSTSVSQLIDTSMFSILAFFAFPMVVTGVSLPIGVIATIIIVEYVVKILLAIGDTPVFYVLTKNE